MFYLRLSHTKFSFLPEGILSRTKGFGLEYQQKMAGFLYMACLPLASGAAWTLKRGRRNISVLWYIFWREGSVFRADIHLTIPAYRV